MMRRRKFPWIVLLFAMATLWAIAEPAPDMRDKLDIVYEGCFFEGGPVGPKRNGEVCVSSVANDPLEAVRRQVRVVEDLTDRHRRCLRFRSPPQAAAVSTSTRRWRRSRKRGS